MCSLSASELQSAFYESLPVILPVLNLKFHLSPRQFYTAVICPVRSFVGRTEGLLTYLMAFLRPTTTTMVIFQI